MTWSLGYTKPNVTYLTNADGSLTANGTVITATGGWLDVPSPPSVVARGGPPHISVRVQLEVDGEGNAMLGAHGVRVAGREFGDLKDFVEAGGLAWAVNLPRALHLEMGRRAAGRNAAPRQRASSVTGFPQVRADQCTTRPLRQAALVAAPIATGSVSPPQR